MEERDHPTLQNGLPQGHDHPVSRREETTLDKVKTTISEKLHGAAQALREKSQSFSGNNQEVAQYGNQAAEWLNRSANYIEEINPQQLKSDIGNQVRQNPGRSLLVAAGIGLVVGALLRRR
jgi:ElaB/YqjD/DUF883 family membrane-anchored ribosome-binding protein